MKRRILVVDDDRVMVRTLCDVLRLQGWEASGAYSGAEAITAAREGRFPLVLMDIKMPGMDGVAAFKAIKQQRPGVRVVLMTAYTAHDLISEAEREGVMRVLPKPVALGALLELLDASLRAERPVLVVDQDRPFLTSLSDVLQVRGYATRTASSLDAAVEQLEGTEPTAVLLHLTLGHIEPHDSVVAIREISPAVALILYSGHPRALDDAKVTMPSDWVYAYLQKPFPLERLTALLDELSDD